MDIVKSIVMGIIQGLTEFLPISSSGHLVLLDHFLKDFGKSNLLFIILLHVATLLVVIIYFWNEFLILVKGGLKFYKFGHDGESKIFWYVVIATMFTVIVALIIEPIVSDIVERNYKLVGIFWIINSLILLLPVIFASHQNTPKTLENISFVDSIIIGISQGIATLPGVSRSGTTISTALLLGIERSTSGVFSFLIFIPAVIGSLVFETYREIKEQGISQFTFDLSSVAGFVTAFIVGYLALHLLMILLKGGKIFYFAMYTFIAGILTLLI